MKGRAIIPAIVASLLAAGSFPVQAQQAANTAPAPGAGPEGDVDVNSGRFLAFGGAYGELRVDCIRCHGMDGSGNSSGAFPRLADQSAWYLYKTLLDYATGLRPSAIMQPIARQLTMEEIENLAAYYASVDDAPYPAEPLMDVNVLQHGGAIAAVGIPDQGVTACDSCHGPNGIGSPPIYPYLAGQFAPYLQNQLLLWKAGQRGGDAMNIMSVIAQNMTEEQIHAVSLYFASVRAVEVTPNELQYLDPETTPISGSTWIDGADMGAIRNPDPGAAAVVPAAEPAAGPAPSVDPPEGLPRQPLAPDALPPPSSPALAGEDLESTTTTTGQEPAAQGEVEPSEDSPREDMDQ